ncbi:MAG TPA: spore coat U domain-containing protein [Acetobacteraceae bacterium]|nr:spore coat U domain-containing protein [Acetobacteraceae bacterium]
MKRVLAASAAVVGLLMAQQAWASQNTATTTLDVSATVDGSCSVSASGGLSFGTVLNAGATDATGTLTVNCTNGLLYNVSLNYGLQPQTNQRYMLGADSTTTLAYNLYQDSAHDTPWGTNVGTDTVAGTGTGIDQPLTVYGEVPVLQPQGITNQFYSDTVTVTVTY